MSQVVLGDISCPCSLSQPLLPHCFPSLSLMFHQKPPPSASGQVIRNTSSLHTEQAAGGRNATGMCPGSWHGPSRGGRMGGLRGSALPWCCVRSCLCSVSWRGFCGDFPPLLLSFFPFFTSLPKYSASLSSGAGGPGEVSSWLLGGAGALSCTLRVLLCTGKVGREQGCRGCPASAWVSRGQGWPGGCQLGQWGTSASLPPRGQPGSDSALQGSVVVGRGICTEQELPQKASALFPTDLLPSQTIVATSLGPVLRKGAEGPLGPPRGGTDPKPGESSGSRGLLETLHWGFICVLSPLEMTSPGSWSPGSLSAADI